MTRTAPDTYQPPTSFEGDVQNTVAQLLAAIADVLEAGPGAVRRPTDLSRLMGIDKTLAWKLMRSIDAPDPLAAAQLLPGTSGIEIFLQAAVEKRVPASIVQRALDALAAYEATMRRHAGNRGTFRRMVAGLSKRSRTAVEAAHRKAAFEANSFIWGVKVRTHVSVHIVRPSDEDPHRVDIAGLASFIDLVRLKPDTSWVISRTAYVNKSGVIQPAMPRQSIEQPHIDPAAISPEDSLIKEFCSEPPPRLIRRPVPGNFLETVLLPGPIGETAATTITMGEVYRNVAPRYRTEDDDNATFYLRLRTPAEHFVNIILLRRDEFADELPSFGIYSELDSVLHHPVDLDALQPLTHDTAIQHLGRASGSIIWPREAPHLGEMVRSVCRRLGWPPEEFDVYQARQLYPILRSVAITRFGLRTQN